MSKKQTATLMNYKNRLSKNPEQIQAEQLDSNVEQASISMKMGLLTIESKISKANSTVLEAERNVASAISQLEIAKSSHSSNLVQSLIDSYQSVKQQEANLEAAQKDLLDLRGLQQFLVDTQKELF